MYKILVCDDDKFLCEMMAVNLKKAGHEIFKASCANEAYSLSLENRVELFILDLNMPGDTGLELVDKLHGLPDYKDVPIIMLTSETKAEKVKEGKVRGVAAWATKPISPNKLIQVVGKVMSRSADKK